MRCSATSWRRINGFPDADGALTEAVDLADSTNATLTVMNVVSDPSARLLTGAAYSAAVDVQAISGARNEHQQLLDLAPPASPHPISVTNVLAHGKPSHHYSNR